MLRKYGQNRKEDSMINGNGKQLRRLLKELPVLAKDMVVFLLIFGLILLPVPMTASAAPMKKWGPHVDLTGKLGNERSLGDADLFIPVLQGPDSLFFLDLRFQRDDNDVKEGNYGLGFRKMLDEWIVGGYGFYDVRDTQYDNTFQQWTLGVEALSENYDARLNVYFADEDEEEIGGLAGVDRFEYAGNYLLYGGSYETSMSGVDAEIGGKLPGLAYPEIRGYVGGYYFDTDGTNEVSGPKGRLEVRFPDLFGWDGSLFEVGGEIRHDSVRDTDYFFTARLRIPFGSGTISQPVSSLTPLEKRMTERVMRDPDIVTVRVGSNTTQPLTLGEEPIDITHVNDDGAGGSGTVEDPFGTLNDAAGATTEIVLIHADSALDGDGYAMADDQRLLGESDEVDHLIETDQFGVITLPRVTEGTEVPVISNAEVGITAGNNTEISGLIVDAGGYNTGILLEDLTGPVDINRVDLISGATPLAVYNSSSSVVMDDVSITDGLYTNLYVSGGSADLTITNSALLQTAGTGGTLMDVDGGHTGTITLADSTSLTSEEGATWKGLNFYNADGTYNIQGPVTYLGDDNGIMVQSDSEGTIVFSGPVTIDNAGEFGINMSDSPGTLAFTGDAPLTVDNAAGDGIYVNNSGALIVQGAGNSVAATGGPALNVLDSATDMTFDSLASTNSDESGVLLYNVAGVGIDGNALTVTGNTVVMGATVNGIDVIESRTGSAVTFNGVTIGDSGVSGIYLEANAGSTTVNGPATIYNSSTGSGLEVVGNSGAVRFNDSLEITDSAQYGALIVSNSGPVAAGSSTTIGNSTLDGMYIAGNSAPVSAGATTIYNSGAFGLFAAGNLESVSINGLLDVDDSTLGGIMVSGNPGAFTVTGPTTVDNSGLAGVFVVGNGYNSVAFNSTLDVSNSGSDGVLIGSNTGSVTVAGATSIYNSAGSGLYIADNEQAVSFNDQLDIEDSSIYGALVAGNTGPVTVGGATTIQNSSVFGAYVVANEESVSFNSSLDITDTELVDGMYIAGNLAPVTIEGATTIYNSGGSGLFVAGNQDAVSFGNSLDVDDSGMMGVIVTGNTGAFTVEGPTTVDNSGLVGVYITGNGYNAVTFNDTLDVANSVSDGVLIGGNTGSVTVAGATTIYNSGGSGLYVDSNQQAVSFNDTLEIDDSVVYGMAVTNNDGDVTVADAINVDNSGNHGILLSMNDGEFSAGDTTVTNTGGAGIRVDTNYCSATFGDIYVEDTGNQGIYISATTGDFTAPTTTVYNSAAGYAGVEVGETQAAIDFGIVDILTDEQESTGLLTYNMATLNIDGGTIVANDATAIAMYNTTVAPGSVILSSATSNSADAEGIIMYDVDGGPVQIGSVIVTDSGTEGVAIYNSDSDVELTSVNVTTTGGTGVLLNSNTGAYNSTTINVTDAGLAGVTVYNTAGGVDLGQVTVTNTGLTGSGTSYGVWIAENDGTVAAGDTTIYNSVDAGVYVDTNNAAVAFGGDLSVYNSGAIGVRILDNADAVSVAGATTIYNSADHGMIVRNNAGPVSFYNAVSVTDTGDGIGPFEDGIRISQNGGPITFYNSVHIDDSIGSGLDISGNANTVTIAGPTTIYNSGGIGLFAENNQGSVVLEDTLEIRNSLHGMVLYRNDGPVTVDGAIDIYNSASVGFAADSNTAPVTFNDTLNVDRSGDIGMYVDNNSGPVSFYNTVTVDNSGDGALLFPLAEENGIQVSNNSGAVTFYNAVSVDNTEEDGLFVFRNSGAVAFNDTIAIDNSGSDGMRLVRNDGPITIEGATTIYNSTDIGLGIRNNTNAITFNDDVTVRNTELNDGIQIANNSGPVDVNGTVSVYNAGLVGVEVRTSDGNVTFDDLVVKETDAQGVLLDTNNGDFVVNNTTTVYNSAAGYAAVEVGETTGTVDLGTVDISTVAPEATGLLTYNVAALTIDGGTIAVTDATAIDMYNTTVLGGVTLTSATSDGAAAEGIVLDDVDGGPVSIDTVTVTNSGTEGVAIYNTASAVEITDLDVTTAGGHGLLLDGNTGSYNSATTDIVGVGGNGIMVVDNTMTADFGVTTVTDMDGTPSNGVVINNSTGTYTFDGLDITTYDGSGLVVDNSGVVEVFGSDNDILAYGGSSAGGAALDIYNSAVDLTFDTLSSYNSAVEGVSIDSTSGSLTVTGATTVHNSASIGVAIYNSPGLTSTVDVDLNTVTIDGAEGTAGMFLYGNDGSFVADATTISNSAGLGLAIVGNSGSVTFLDTVDVTESGSYGVGIAGNTGDVAIYNTVAIADSGMDGFIALGNDGDITLYNALTVSGSVYNGVHLTMNDGEFSAGDTTITDSGTNGLLIDTNYCSATFGNLVVQDTGNRGIYIIDTTGDFTAPTTTVYNSAAGYAAVEIGETQAAIDLGIVDIQTDKTEATGLLTYNMATLNIDGGTIVTTDATAVDMYNTTIFPGSVTLYNVTSIGADNEGIVLEDVDGGSFTVGQAIITNTGTDGIAIYNTTSAVEITDVDVTTAGGHGLLLDGNTTTYNSATTDIVGVGGDGIMIVDNTMTADFGITNVTDMDGTPSDGVVVYNSAGTYTFDALNVTTYDGSGLVAYNSGVVEVFGSDNDILAYGGSSSGGAALDIYNSAVDLTFDTLSSYNSAIDGVVLDSASGSLTVTGATIVNNSAGIGVAIYNSPGFTSTVDVDLNTVNIDNTEGPVAMYLSGNEGSFAADATTIDNSLGDGLYVHENYNSVTFNETLTVSNSGAMTGSVVIASNNDTVTVEGATNIYNSSGMVGLLVMGNEADVIFNDLVDVEQTAGIGLYVFDNGYNAVTFNDTVDVTDSGTGGLYITANDGAVTVAGATTIYNSGAVGLAITNNTDAVTFLDTVSVTESDQVGIGVGSNSGDVTIYNTVEVTDSGIDGFFVINNDGDVSLNKDLTVTDSLYNGVHLSVNNGEFSVAGATSIYNSGTTGLLIDTNYNSATFASLEVGDTGSQGIYITDTTGDVTSGSTTVYNGAANFAAVEIDTTLAAIDLGSVDITTTAYNAIGLLTNEVDNLTIRGGSISTQNATAIDMYNTVIGVDGITLDSVSAREAVNPDGSGVILEGVSGGDFVATNVTIYNTTWGGFEMINTSANVAILGTLDVDLAGTEGLLIEESSGDFTADTTLITRTGGSGVVVYNSSGTVDLGANLVINETGNHGIALYNSADFALTGGTIDNTTNSGVYVVDTSLSLDGTQIGVSGPIGAAGVAVSSVDADDISVALDNLTLSNIGTTGILLDGSAAGSGTLYVTSFDSNTVTDAGWKGVEINAATFDADPLTAGIQSVVGGTTTIGDSGDTTQINLAGMVLYNVAGSIGFDELNIYNDGGTGLYIRDAGGKTGDFAFSTADGEVITTNGTAIDIDPVALDMTLSNVSSSDAGSAGIIMDTVSGTVNIGTVDIYNSGTVGVAISNSTADVSIGSLAIDRTGTEGLLLDSNDGSFTVTGETTIDNTTGAGVAVYNSASNGSVSFAGNVTINDSAAEGIALVDNAGNFEILGTTTVDNASAASVAIYNTVGNEYIGDVDLGIVNITDRQATGLYIFGTNAAINVNDISIDGNDPTAGISIEDTGALGSVSITSASVSNSGAEGIALYDNEGDVSVLGGTISAASGTAFLVDGGSSAVVYNGSIVNNSVGYSVEIANVTGGSVSLDGDIIDTGQGISIHDNSGGDINFTGTTLSLTPVVPTTTPLNVVDNSGSVITFDNDTFTLVSSLATALNATGGGTLNILGPDNEIIAQTGQAVNISDMEIDITLNTIFSTSSLSGVGVSIYNTAAGSSFTVLGDGAIPSQILGSLGDGIVIEDSEGTFVFNDVAITTPMYNGVVLTNNDADITFNDLTVIGSATSSAGVAATNSSVTLNSATLSNTSFAGVYAEADDGGIYNVAVLDSTIGTPMGGIIVGSYNSSTINSVIQGNTISSTIDDVVLLGDADLNLGAYPATLVGYGYKPEPYDATSNAELFNVLSTENTLSGTVYNSSTLNVDLYNAASLGF